MNTWQLLRELKRRIAAARWASGARVFASSNAVIVSVAPEDRSLGSIRLPAVVLSPLGMDADQQEPGLLQQRLRVRLMNSLPGDPFGETVLIGGYATTSEITPGRGLLELEELLYNEIRSLRKDHGIEIIVTSASAASAVLLEKIGYVAWRDYESVAWVTDEKSFPRPVDLEAVVTTATQVLLTWKNPPTTRFDFRRMMLRRIAGPTTPGAGAGTELTLTTDTSESYTDSGLAAGVYTYGLWAIYDDLGNTVDTDRNFTSVMSLTVTMA